jgi:undecaprenyl-diphosphatase
MQSDMPDGVPNRLRSRLDPTKRYSVRVVLFAVAIVLVAIPFATLLFQVVAKGPLTRLDASVANRLNDIVHNTPGMVGGLRAVSWLGGPPFLTLLTVVAAGFVLVRGRRRLVVFLVVTCLGGGLIDTAVKLVVARPRPVVDHPIAEAFGKSFPSGHAMSSTVVYGALLLVFLPAAGRRRRALVALTMAVVLAVGCSRLLLGVHFVSDVLGGFVLGLAWLIASVAAFETWREDRGKPRTDPLAEGVEPEAAPALRGEES